jgi:ABC-2 type transport system ATP-binding protein
MSGVLRERADAGVPVMFSSHQLDLVERLCDRVGIVRQGRIVAVGTVDELRAGGRDELVVRAPQAPPGWADLLPGVTVLGVSGEVTRLALAGGADDQVVLRAALGTGPVHEFAHVRPSLTDLFRHLVGASSPEGGPDRQFAGKPGREPGGRTGHQPGAEAGAALEAEPGGEQ